MAVSSPTTKAGSISNNGNTNYGPALVVLTSLFFMWGFITCLNDILIPHLKAAFDLNYTESMLIQFCFFFAYFVVSLPAGKYIEKLGYQRGIVIGLFMAGIGTLMFYPAAGTRSYVLFLVALFILASGITILQVAANPYVAILGKPKTASARLNLTQAFNSLGTTIAPYLGALLILSVAIKTTEDIKKLEPNQIVKYIEDLKIAKSVSDFKTMDKNEIIRFLITNQKSIDIASSFDSLKNLKGIELNNYISNHSIKIKPESLNRMSDIDIKEKILEPIEKKLDIENKRLSDLNKDELILIVQSKNLVKNPNDFTKISNSELSAYLDAHKSTEYYKTLEMNAVKYPYLGLTAILFFIGGIFAIIKLPKIEASEVKSSEDNEASYDDKHKSAWEYKHLVLGAIAIFVYVGGEVSIGSFLVNYLGQPFIAGLSEAEAGKYVSFYWGGAMVGRFIGSYIQRMIKPGIVLGFNAAIAAILVIITMLTNGQIAMWSILVIGLFNSIMFPTIFTLAIDGLGKHTGQGSGILCMAIVGGAIIPLLQGLLADNIGIHHAFILPVLCYVYIAYYGVKGHIPTFKTAEA